MEYLSRAVQPQRGGTQQVYALHGPDASLELSMLRALMQLTVDALPVLPALLQAPPARAEQPQPAHALLPPPSEQLPSTAGGASLEPQQQHALGHGQEGRGDRQPTGLGEGTSDPRVTELSVAVKATAEADGLNTAQAAALRCAAAWLEPDAEVRQRHLIFMSAVLRHAVTLPTYQRN